MGYMHDLGGCQHRLPPLTALRRNSLQPLYACTYMAPMRACICVCICVYTPQKSPEKIKAHVLKLYLKSRASGKGGN